LCLGVHVLMGRARAGHGQRADRSRPTQLLGVGRRTCLLAFTLVALGLAGCGSGDGGPEVTEGLSLSLQVPAEARAGETVALRQVLKNVGDAPVELGLGGREDSGFCRDFVISTPDRVDVWRFLDPDPPVVLVCQASLSLKTLGPGEELVLEGEWDETDTHSVPVPAGRYLVRGLLDIRLGVDTPEERRLTLETDTKPLVIVGEQAPPPLTLSLQVPSPVKAGEPVRLWLVAKNTTDAPVTLGLRSPPNPCRDFVVSTGDGVEVWRFLDTVDCSFFGMSSGIKTFNPGEELVLEGEWRQVDAQGAPVAAGS
jgi:hypothetical protein